MVTKTSAEIDSLQYRRGCALQKIPKKAPLEVYEWEPAEAEVGSAWFLTPRPWTLSQHQYMLVPSAVAKSGSAGCLGISWPHVISGWFMWRRKARAFSFAFYLMEISFPSHNSPSAGIWVIFFSSWLCQTAANCLGIWPQQRVRPVLDWDKVHLTWQVYPKAPRAVGCVLYLITHSHATGVEWGTGQG